MTKAEALNVLSVDPSRPEGLEKLLISRAFVYGNTPAEVAARLDRSVDELLRQLDVDPARLSAPALLQAA